MCSAFRRHEFDLVYIFLFHSILFCVGTVLEMFGELGESCFSVNLYDTGTLIASMECGTLGFLFHNSSNSPVKLFKYEPPFQFESNISHLPSSDVLCVDFNAHNELCGSDYLDAK